MRIFLFLFILLSSISMAIAQNDAIEWSEDYQLSLGDFKNPESEINPNVSSVFVQSGATIELGFQMSNFSFMFTKHFNDKVICKFRKKTALLIAKDTLNAERMVKLSLFDFDLSELYARKIRKELYENKKAFSKANFFEPYFSKMIEERNEISGKLYKASAFGEKMEVVEKEHASVLKEIETLANFCKDCKPPKKKKK